VLRGGYDGRRDVRLYRDRETAETQFDDHSRQGGWGGISYSRVQKLRLDGDVRIRTGAPSDRSLTWSGLGDVGPFTSTHLHLRGRWSMFTSDAMDTRLASLGLGADPWGGLHLELTGGLRDTEDQFGGAGARGHWYSAEADVAVLARAYLSGSIDRDVGNEGRITQLATTLSWRF
jgi:hypothetical protein